MIYTTTPEQYKHAEKIAEKIQQSGFPYSFCTKLLAVAKEYEGTYDLMVLWEEEDDIAELRALERDFVAEVEESWERIYKENHKPLEGN